MKTPIGDIPAKYLPELASIAGIKLVNGKWVFESEFVKISKEKQNEKGKMEFTESKAWIPIRAYNFEYHFLKTKNVEEALRKTNNTYLPEWEGFASYSDLLDSVRFTPE